MRQPQAARRPHPQFGLGPLPLGLRHEPAGEQFRHGGGAAQRPRPDEFAGGETGRAAGRAGAGGGRTADSRRGGAGRPAGRENPLQGMREDGRPAGVGGGRRLQGRDGCPQPPRARVATLLQPVGVDKASRVIVGVLQDRRWQEGSHGRGGPAACARARRRKLGRESLQVRVADAHAGGRSGRAAEQRWPALRPRAGDPAVVRPFPAPTQATQGLGAGRHSTPRPRSGCSSAPGGQAAQVGGGGSCWAGSSTSATPSTTPTAGASCTAT